MILHVTVEDFTNKKAFFISHLWYTIMSMILNIKHPTDFTESCYRITLNLSKNTPES